MSTTSGVRMDLETNSAGKQKILASGVHGRTLVARTWFGRTRKEVADEYLRYNYENGVLEVEKKPGCRGMQRFGKMRGDVAEFTTISYWSSMEAMHHDGGYEVDREVGTWRDAEGGHSTLVRP